MGGFNSSSPNAIKKTLSIHIYLKKGSKLSMLSVDLYKIALPTIIKDLFHNSINVWAKELIAAVKE